MKLLVILFLLILFCHLTLGAIDFDQELSREEQQQFDEMSSLGRWFARPLMRFVTQQRQSTPQTTSSPTVEGLNVLLARLRRTMKEHRIERVETMGQPFDAETMNAIGTVESQDHPAGHVAEQLSPGQLARAQALSTQCQQSSFEDCGEPNSLQGTVDHVRPWPATAHRETSSSHCSSWTGLGGT